MSNSSQGEEPLAASSPVAFVFLLVVLQSCACEFNERRGAPKQGMLSESVGLAGNMHAKAHWRGRTPLERSPFPIGLISADCMWLHCVCVRRKACGGHGACYTQQWVARVLSDSEQPETRY
jgi:hypothetical protein